MPCESVTLTVPLKRTRAGEPNGHGFWHHRQGDAQGQESEGEFRLTRQQHFDAGEAN